MKIFFDTEFTGLHRYTTLISIGLISENQRTFYAEFNDYDNRQINDWLRQNVLPHLQFIDINCIVPELNLENYRIKSNRQEVTKIMSQWLAQFEYIEMWADYPAYDWVLFCDLFGGSFHLPKNIYCNSFDVATIMKIAGVENIGRNKFVGFYDVNIHNALYQIR